MNNERIQVSYLETDKIITAASGIFSALDLNNIDNLSLSGVDVTITSGVVSLTNPLSAPNLVYNTGNQTISGIKTFVTGIVAPNIVYNTGDQTISGTKNFNNGLNINNNYLFYSQPSGFFSGIGVSGTGDGGYFIGRSKLSQNTLILKDESFGKNSVAKESIRNWQSVAISANGQYQTAVTNVGGFIYISNDYGDTWQQKASALSWFRIAMSADGKYQTASTYNSPFGYLYTSDNYGYTWTQIPTSETSIQKIAMSSDGKIQIFVRYTTNEYSISRDYGKTWTNGTVNSTSGAKGVAISSDGKYITIVGAGSNDRIYISSNYGSSWTSIGSIGTWNSVAMSSDGKFQAAARGGLGNIYISNDYGNTWSIKNKSGLYLWLSISMSSDGKYIAATTDGNYNYVSYDYGENWIVSHINNRAAGSLYTCYDIAVSSDGKYMLTAALARYIYVSKTEEKLNGNFYADNIYGNNLIYNTGDQTISGVKTFATGVVIPNVVYNTGTQSISGVKTFASPVFISNISGVSGSGISIITNFASSNLGDSIIISSASGSTIGGDVNLYAGNSANIPGNLKLYVGRNNATSKGTIYLDGDIQVNPFFGTPGSNQHNSSITIYKTGTYGSASDILNIDQSNAIMELKNGLIVSGLISGNTLTGVFDKVIANNLVYNTGQILNTTYSTLTGLKAASGLLSGQLYRISDFVLKWNNQSINDQTVKTAASGEPLIVTALSNNKIHHIAQSEIYPQDTIYYNIDASGSYSWGNINNNAAIPDFKGWIYRRVDNLLNIDIPYDWRNIRVNCCKPDVSSVPNYSGNYQYNIFNFVKETGNNSNRGKLYYSFVTGNSGNALGNTDFWRPVSPYIESGTYFPTDENYGFLGLYEEFYGADFLIILPPITSSRIQQPIFTSTVTGLGTFSLKDVFNVKIEGGHSNVIIGDYFNNNTIGDYFSYNIIGRLFYNNTIGNYFYQNVIGQSFLNNTLGNSCVYNIIGDTFASNTIGHIFSYNNNIGYLSNNIIGNNFFNNLNGTSFNSNVIGNNFGPNIIKNTFFNNTIGNVFNFNIIGGGFGYNTIANNFYSNTIGNSFNTNTIGSNFNSNTIGNSFNDNTIENVFETNTIGSSFNANTIANYFNSNTIGNSFGNNTIANIFENNTIGNNFASNTSEDNINGIDFTSSTHVYSGYNTTLFKNAALSQRLRYFDSADQLVVTNPES